MDNHLFFGINRTVGVLIFKYKLGKILPNNHKGVFIITRVCLNPIQRRMARPNSNAKALTASLAKISLNKAKIIIKSIHSNPQAADLHQIYTKFMFSYFFQANNIVASYKAYAKVFSSIFLSILFPYNPIIKSLSK